MLPNGLSKAPIARSASVSGPRRRLCPIHQSCFWRDVSRHRRATQKPVGIFTPLIEAFTKPGDTVLDPFCGSGSTLVAARDLDRHFIGVELDPAHHRTASLRLLRKEPPGLSA